MISITVIRSTIINRYCTTTIMVIIVVIENSTVFDVRCAEAIPNSITVACYGAIIDVCKRRICYINRIKTFISTRNKTISNGIENFHCYISIVDYNSTTCACSTANTLKDTTINMNVAATCINTKNVNTIPIAYT